MQAQGQGQQMERQRWGRLSSAEVEVAALLNRVTQFEQENLRLEKSLYAREAELYDLKTTVAAAAAATGVSLLAYVEFSELAQELLV
eukprot:2076396-Prymnesium_polylepis.2